MTQHSPRNPHDPAFRPQYQAAVALFRDARLAESEDTLRKILSQHAGFADAFQMLGVIASKRGEHDKAIELISKAVAIDPNQAGYHYNLAKAYEGAENIDAAISAYRESIRLNTANPSSWLNLSSMLLRKSNPEAAAKVANEALRLQPNSVPALNNLGIALSRIEGRLDEAELVFQHALKLKPDQADTHVNLARMLSAQDRNDEATHLLRKAIDLAPTMAEAYNNLSSTLKFEGKLEEALDCSHRALELQPGATPHSNLLFNLNYYPHIEPERLYREHLAWAEKYASAPASAIAQHQNDANMHRQLRIGYLSPDFRKHPVATFMQPIIASHHPDRVKIYCYANVEKIDDMSKWFQSHSDEWRDIYGLTDSQAAELIRNDKIDILVELAGHTGGNRLPLMALRPAPVQASYLGYLGTTGLSAIDYKITDAITDPPGATEAFYSEKLARLPHGMWCYSPPPDAAEVAPAPVLRNSHITFASFNNSAKVSKDVVRVWADILRTVPNSKLLMLTKGEGSVHTFFGREFEDRGIDSSRIDLRTRVPFQDYLNLHADVDIALDPFPYTGGTTTCHALWMGVPVITLPGLRPFSRSSAGILTTLGLSDWIATSPDDYVRIAAEKASDPDGLQHMRESLRARMQASPLTQGDAFTRSLEDCYSQMWHSWCNANLT